MSAPSAVPSSAVLPADATTGGPREAVPMADATVLSKASGVRVPRKSPPPVVQTDNKAVAAPRGSFRHRKALS